MSENFKLILCLVIMTFISVMSITYILGNTLRINAYDYNGIHCEPFLNKIVCIYPYGDKK